MNYREFRSRIFNSESGKGTLAAVRRVTKLTQETLTAGIVIDRVYRINSFANGWDVLNSLDLMTETGELVELTAGENVPWQNRLFQVPTHVP